MTGHNSGLCERLKKLGFTQQSNVKLYGEEFLVLSDPIVTTEDLVFIEVMEKKSLQQRRVRIPLSIVNIANSQRVAA
jgi:hypothetical protein